MCLFIVKLLSQTSELNDAIIKSRGWKKGERLDSCGWLNYHITYNCMNPNEDKKSILVFQNKVLTFLSSRIKTIGRS